MVFGDYFSIGKSEIASISTARWGGPRAPLDIAATAITRGEVTANSDAGWKKELPADLVTIRSDAAPLLRRGDGNMVAPPSISLDRYRIFLYRRSLPGQLLIPGAGAASIDPADAFG